MKKQTLLFLLFIAFCVTFFTSCANHDYDLTNDNIDAKVLLSPDGINLPFGNVDKVIIYEKLGYDSIKVADDGSLYIEYGGNLDPEQFAIPNYTNLPYISDVTTGNTSIDGISGRFDSSILPGNNFPLLTDETINYNVTKISFENENWTIEPDSISFNSFTINLNPFLGGFSYVSGDAKLNLYITVPKDFEVDEPLTAGKIVRSIEFNKNINGGYTVPGIKIKSYKYPANGFSAIIYDLKLEEMNGFIADVTNPLFNLTLSTDNNNIVINSATGTLTGKEVVADEISGFEDLKNTFGNDAVLHFDNPSLFMSVTTNFGANFNLDIDKIDANNGNSVSLTGSDGLSFAKPSVANTQKTTSYFIAPNPNQGAPAGAIGKSLALDKLFTSIPDKINYQFSINVNDKDVTISHTGVLLQGNYQLKLPFSFKNLKINVKIPPQDMGENIYDNFLQYVQKNIIIQADTVNISVNKISQLNITATVNFLDADQNEIELSDVKSVTLANGPNINKFSVEFSKQDLEKLENARYLEISFTVEGNGALTKDDYIDIRKIRFISDGGILYDLK